MRRIATLLLLSLSPVSGALAADCPWLQASKLDELWPDAAPWAVMVGGPGSCKFTSDATHPANIVGANQMVKASAAEAESFVAGLQGTMAKSYVVAPYPTLGKAAFTYRPKPGSGMEGRSVYFVAHQGKAAVIASLVLQHDVAAADLAAGEQFVRAALAIGSDAVAQAEATSCPWFVTEILVKLLPGPGFSQQQFGSNSCMAQAGGKAVIVSISESAGTAATSRGDCTSAPAAALGASGELLFACKGGRPVAKVRYITGNRAIEYSFAPGQEPTEAERALLIDLAVRAPARQ